MLGIRRTLGIDDRCWTQVGISVHFKLPSNMTGWIYEYNPEDPRHHNFAGSTVSNETAYICFNQPASSESRARDCFIPLTTLARALDPGRPICFANVMFAPYADDLSSDLFDVLFLNRYYGWYVEKGDLATAAIKLERELLGWQRLYGKPMIMAEYGADTLAGLHAVRDTPWSEEY